MKYGVEDLFRWRPYFHLLFQFFLAALLLLRLLLRSFHFTDVQSERKKCEAKC